MLKFKKLKKTLTICLSLLTVSIMTPVVFVNNIGANTKDRILLVNNNISSLTDEKENECYPITVKLADTDILKSKPSLIWNKLQTKQEKLISELTDNDNIQINKFSLEDLYICGDSISAGFALNNNINKQMVFTKVGIPCIRMFEKQYVNDSNEVDLLTSLKEIQPKYLLLIYGTNDLGYDISADKFSDKYMENIAKIREVSPNTVFFIGSIPPIDSTFSTNKRVKEFNKSLEEKVNNTDNAIFIDYYSALLDSSGKLDPQYNAGDGIHLSMNAYDIILKYICYE